MKRDRQSNLQQQLEDLRQGLRTVPDLLAIRYSDADSNVVINATQVSASSSYMPYSRAYKWLLERHEALPHEFAMWVWLGTSLGGLDAFTNPGDVGGPQRFRIGYWEDMDYLSPLTACWFNVDEIENFAPVKRFVRSRVLVERWRVMPGMSEAGCVEAFIRAQVEAGYLTEVHPIAGFTQWSRPADPNAPPVDSAMFVLSTIDSIEAMHFEDEGSAPETDDIKSEHVPA